jgi:DNA-binding SARP family transcriptional activator
MSIVYGGRSPRSPREASFRTEGSGYLLAVPDGVIDLGIFEKLTTAGTEALNTGDPGLAAECLRGALGMWRGPLLADVDVEVVRQERRRMEEVRLNAYEMRLEAELRLGLNIHVVPELEQFIAAQPFRETLWATLMRALNAGGRRMEALAAYRRLTGSSIRNSAFSRTPKCSGFTRTSLTGTLTV